MKNISTFEEFLSEAAAINQPVTDKETNVEETDIKTEECDDDEEEMKVTEALKLPHASVSYAETIWQSYEKDLVALVKKINIKEFTGEDSETVCEGLSVIFDALSREDEGKLSNSLNA